MLQYSNTQRKGPSHLLVAKCLPIVAAQPFWLVIKLDMQAVAKLTEAMQIIVNASGKAVEKLVILHCLNNVVEALDLGFTNFLQVVRRNVGNAFLRVFLCTINDLIERGLDDRICLDDKLVECIVLVRGTQMTQRLATMNLSGRLRLPGMPLRQSSTAHKPNNNLQEATMPNMQSASDSDSEYQNRGASAALQIMGLGECVPEILLPIQTLAKARSVVV